MAIPLKNRFEALQAQDPCASQPQETIIENIKKKRLTKEKSNQTAHSPGHVTDNHEQKQCRPDKHPPPAPPKKTTPQPTTSLKNQTHKGLPPSHPAEDQAGPPTSAKGARPPPINITLQDPKDTTILMENSLKIKNFHIKRIHAGKHVLYLQNLNYHAKAKKILTAANMAYFTYTPKSQ